MKIKLKRAINFHGEYVKEVELNFDELTGNDLIEAEKQVMASDNIPMVTDFNKAYLIAVASRLIKVPADELRNMNAKDFSKIITEVQRFLLGSDSSDTSEATTPETVSETLSGE